MVRRDLTRSEERRSLYQRLSSSPADIQRTGDHEFAIQPADLIKATQKPQSTATSERSRLEAAEAMSMRTTAHKAAQTRRATQSFGVRHGMRHR